VHKHTVAERFEAEVLPGLEPFAEAELKGLSGVQRVSAAVGAVGFHFLGDAARLKTLRTVVSVYRVLHFAVPRPKALLGHEHFSRLTRMVAELGRTERFASFRLSAAGSDSGVFTRFNALLAQETGLAHEDEGELLIRVRRAGTGWDVLLRLTPRPLSARAWRVCNLSGGLNATLASAMLELAQLKPTDRLFNPMCGSGTLLVEAALHAPPARLVGCDHGEASLSCSAENLAAAGVSAELLAADATATGLEAESFEVIVSDPPWGDAVGSHTGNTELYPALLQECARLAAPGARFVLLTHELKLFERVLGAQTFWRVEAQLQVFHGGHYPRAYLLLPR
jgi:tRNA (guanine6-N2)-methyltransferase